MATGPVYKVAVEAWSNTTPSTQDIFTELAASPNTTTVRIVRFRIGVAQNPPTTEVAIKIGVYRKTSLLTSGGTAVTPNQLAATDPPSGASVYVKTGTTSFGVGTCAVGGTLWQNAINMRTTYDWIPASDAEYLESAVGGAMSLDLLVAGTSMLIRTEVDFIV